ncbi:hypothetical protein SK128_000712, partial [Halocaridina rubra]
MSSASTNRSPQLISVHLLHDDRTSRLQMLHDKGADVTITGICHLELLRIPRTRLQPLLVTTTLTADGSQMSFALGWFQATLKLGNKSCIAKIQVHEGIQTQLLSFGLCQELAIILPDILKLILAVPHVNRCSKLSLPTVTSLSAARDLFLCEFRDILVSRRTSRQLHSRK